MTDHPRSVFGPHRANSPEEAYHLANEAWRTLYKLQPGTEEMLRDMTLVLSELLHNAADHASPDGDRPWAVHLDLTYDPQQRRYLLTVSDTGQGINHSLNGPGTKVADHEAILDATQRGRSSTGDRDRGLGLNNALTMARPKGRTLTISSRRGFLMLHENGRIESADIPPYPGTQVCATFTV